VSSLVALQDALRKEPRNPAHWIRIGCELHARGRDGQALVCLDRATELAPGHVDATYNRGVVLQALGRAGEALACYEAVLSAMPSHPFAEDNRLSALLALDRPEEAIPGLERRLAGGARDADTLVNLGLARQAQGDHESARSAFEEALAITPGHRLAGWNLALLELRRGESASGFARYEAHWPGTSRVNPARDFARPLWGAGESLEGRTLLLHADEGLGDTIQSLRFVPEIARRASSVVLEVPRGLAPLARSLRTPVEVVEAGEALPATDLHAPLHVLPARLGESWASFAEPSPYLHADAERVAHWRERLGAGGGTCVGVAWRGSASYADDRFRSMDLARLRPLFGMEGVRLVSLQLDPPGRDAAALAEPGAPEPLAQAARGMAETAALVAALDLVISVDTAIAHLAGALGRPVWVLLASRADWRWLEGTDRTAWYPAATLFRAARGETWDDVTPRVRDALRRFVKLRT